MKLRKVLSTLAFSTIICGALALQGCFEEPYAAGPGYGYGAGYGSVYGGPPVVVGGPQVGYGDWDEHHAWHQRDWWGANRRPWVQEHHQEWLTARPAPHEMYGHQQQHGRD